MIYGRHTNQHAMRCRSVMTENGTGRIIMKKKLHRTRTHRVFKNYNSSKNIQSTKVKLHRKGL